MPQTTDYSQGRNPTDPARRELYRVPTPDVTNPLLPVGANGQFDAAQRNLALQSDRQQSWHGLVRTGYNDTVTGWSSGIGVLHQENRADSPPMHHPGTPVESSEFGRITSAVTSHSSVDPAIAVGAIYGVD